MNQPQALLLTLAAEVPLLLLLAHWQAIVHSARHPARPASAAAPATRAARPAARIAPTAGWLARLPAALASGLTSGMASGLTVGLAAIAASCLTHPLAWHAASVLAADEYQRGIWLIEVLVVLAEALVYSLLLRPGWRHALLWSVLANSASFALGQLPLWG